MSEHGDAAGDDLMLRSVLLVGYGKLGSQLGQRLIDRGIRVAGLRRSAHVSESRVQLIPFDLMQESADQLEAFDAMVITITPSIGSPSFDDGYVRALQNLRRALPSIPARTIFVSSTGVFDSEYGDEPITELVHPEPRTKRSQTLLDGETVAKQLFNALIVRPTGIYGAERDFLIRKVLAGEPADFGRVTNRVHDVDLARALERMLLSAHPPALVHAVDERPASLGEVVGFIASELGVPAPPRADSADSPRRVFDGSKFRELLGALEYPSFEAGYRQMVAERR
ncbi:hypothetical protein [Humidisolicoccus flavus]|uniref:hypothetical protein n=1 Tax=Humidisolicoccus flavus TaxID=3111414 RepID=UPI00324BDAFA